MAWWQYVFAISQPDNPLLDFTGAMCQVGQSGQVFFLVGAVLGGPDTVSRTCTVAPGHFLFFPIVTLEDNVAEEAQNPIVSAPVTASKMATLLDCLIVGGTTPFSAPFDSCQGVTSLYARIDGRVLSNLTAYRAKSPTFSIEVPAAPPPNLEEAFNTSVSGTVKPVVADGYYLMLAPLSKGEHIINFGGTFGSPIDSKLSDITYHLTVR